MADGTVNPKDAVGANKPSVTAMPHRPLFEVAATFNVAEYGLYNWREKPVSISGHVDAIQRHIVEIREGHDFDAKSKKRHLAHIAATAIILMDAMDHGTLVDDRWKPKQLPCSERFCIVCVAPGACLRADRCLLRCAG